ncbi:MAG TPA: aminoacyl-tRNA hydrolase, partial [Candidatus Andersenbacteria bacterium]|nr:aminoacyl-tRNA hydrolase [Candidatus Andersenbacteria bacterium]
GKAVAQYLRYNEINKKNILVIHDDLELALGDVKYQEAGSAHGHNGMRSIHQYVGDTDIPQLRIGIGRPIDQRPIEKFVLEKFKPEERAILQEKRQVILDAITKVIEPRRNQE